MHPSGDLRPAPKLNEFDGILLVHYDYFENHPSSIYDKSKLYDAWSLMQENAIAEKKQVFAIGERDTQTDNILNKDFHYISPTKTCEERVREIVENLGKSPEKIRLLFGGILSDNCVYDHLVGMCTSVDDAGVGPGEDYILSSLSNTKIGYGRLVPELTEMAYRL